MNNSTKIIVGLSILAVGVILYFNKAKKTLPQRRNTGNGGGADTGISGTDTDEGTDNGNTYLDDSVPTNPIGTGTDNGNTYLDDSVPTNPIGTHTEGTITNAGTTITNTGIPRPNPCPPQAGFTVTSYNAATTNIERIKQMCKESGVWTTTNTGGCCKVRIKPTTVINPTTISSPVINQTNPSNQSNQSNCFVENTKVSMSDGTKMNIQDVKVGMEVLSYNDETKNQEFSKVESIITSSTFELVKISTKSGIEIICTKEHPFWVVDSVTGWVQAILLDKGDMLLLENCLPDEIISIKSNKVKETPIYNLQISNNKTYYANGILVHNKTLVFGQTYYGQQAGDIVQQLQNLYEDQLSYNNYSSYPNPTTY